MPETIALITLYHPDDSCAENVRRIAEQTDRVFLCDNSPNENGALFCAIPNAEYLFFGENRGLSAAFNTVFRRYRESFRPDDFILFFDQDSTPPEGHIQKLTALFLALEQQGYPVGCLGPVYFNPNTGKLNIPRVRRRLCEGVFSVESVITASLLTRFHILEEVSFWNERCFLDMADWDLCWRIRAAGYLCCAAEEIVLRHCLGLNVKTEGAASARRKRMVREYYQLREALYLRRQPYTPLRFRLKFFNMLTFKAAHRLLRFEDRAARFWLYRAARRDSRAGYSGPWRDDA